MFTPGTLLTAFLILAAGGVVWWFTRKNDRSDKMTLPEYGVASLVALVAIIPSSLAVGTAMAQSASIGGYKEFHNGSLVRAESKTIECRKNGSCRNTYQCDPYEVTVQTGTDKDGNPTYGTETHYESCPYASQETTYWLVDSFESDHVIGRAWLDANPQPWETGWGREAIPGDLPRGIPEQWKHAKMSIDLGDPEPVTRIESYDNYLLASQSSLLKQYSDSIEKYKEQNLLPQHTENMLDNPIYESYKARKVVFAGGVEPSSADIWQNALGRVNARLGNERQGDLHMVVVPAEVVDSPADYSNALIAYWQDRETFGKKSLGKNAIVVIIGLDRSSNTVAWSQAKTGVPEGNGTLISALTNDLKDLPFEAKTLVGWPKAKVSDDNIEYTPSGGKIESILIDSDDPFLRPCMECEDEGDNGSGYVYLESSAYISKTSKAMINIAAFIVSMVLYFLTVRFDPFRGKKTEESEEDLYYGRRTYSGYRY